MPPKPKFTREEITKTALNLVRKEGLEKLTARYLGKKLGSSSFPIFTVFENMDELHEEVIKAAMSLYNQYVKRALKSESPFKEIGKQYILFAIKEPILFQILFMSEKDKKPSIENTLPFIDNNYKEILISIQNTYNLPESKANKLYLHLWIYTHGIATLCANRMCVFSAEEINTRLTEVFEALIKDIS